jgi:hypothetical protein
MICLKFFKATKYRAPCPITAVVTVLPSKPATWHLFGDQPRTQNPKPIPNNEIRKETVKPTKISRNQYPPSNGRR